MLAERTLFYFSKTLIYYSSVKLVILCKTDNFNWLLRYKSLSKLYYIPYFISLVCASFFYDLNIGLMGIIQYLFRI